MTSAAPDSVRDRAARERESHNRGLERGGYNRLLRHTTAYSAEERRARLYEGLRRGQDARVLEIGSSAWTRWLPDAGVVPRELHVINISEAELERGRREGAAATLNPHFHLMDAHQLEFEDESFDLVYGGAILHHLDLDTVLGQIRRVLKPSGSMIFVEPLNVNPFAKLTRRLTPFARTDDELPFGYRELSALRCHFDVELEVYELSTVPAGVVSGLMFDDPRNALMRAAYRFDTLVKRVVPPLRMLYRKVLIDGRPRLAT